MITAAGLLKLCGRSHILLTSAKYSRHYVRTGIAALPIKSYKSFHWTVRCWMQSLKETSQRKPTEQLGLLLKLGVGGGLVGGSILARVAECKNKIADPSVSRRLLDYNGYANDPAPSFDWVKFGRMLYQDVFLLLVAVASAIGVALLSIRLPIMLGKVVNVLTTFSTGQQAQTNFLSIMGPPALQIIYLYLVQSLLTFVYIASLGSVGENMAAQLRKELFSSILKQDIAFFDKHKTGEIVNRLTTDVQDFKSSFKTCISQGLRSFAQTAGCMGTLYQISSKMTLLMLVVLPTVIAIGAMIGSVLRKFSRAAQTQISVAISVSDEAISNVRTVRAFAMEEKEMSLFNQEVEKAQHMNKVLGLGIGVFQGLSNLFLNGTVLAVLVVGGSLMHEQQISPGDLMAFLVASQTVQRSLSQLSLLFGQYVRGMTAGARVFEYINLKPNIPLDGGIIIPKHSLMGDVEFRNITFAYPTREEQIVLSNFNLRIPPGKMVALCGISGGGKSTVAALLERFYDVNHGSITVDGKDIRKLDPSWLRGNVIGFINQEPVLFATSVMENIRYGRPEASDAEVIEASKLANADEFINSFPNGYHTILGERGVTVSGGQKQRIAIARALLKNPSILILDEATSALDSESEHLVQEALDNVTKGRTVLVIAHRLSTIQNADMIAVLSKGVIAEMGTHESLKKLKGLYWDLIQTQEKLKKIDDVIKASRTPGEK